MMGGFNGFFVDVVGPAGDLMYGLTDNFYDPCAPRVTVGVGEKVPVVIRAGGGIVVGVGQPMEIQQNLENNVVQITAQSVSIGVSQPGGASNPVRQNQPQSATQPQTIAVVPVDKAALAEFANGYQNAGVTLLTPKVVDAAQAAAKGILLNDAAKVVQTLSQQIAVEIESSRQAAQLLSQSDEILYRNLAQLLRTNQQNLTSVLQRSGVGFNQISEIKNAMFTSDNALLEQVLQKSGLTDKIPSITKNLQTSVQNVAVSLC